MFLAVPIKFLSIYLFYEWLLEFDTSQPLTTPQIQESAEWRNWKVIMVDDQLWCQA